MNLTKFRYQPLARDPFSRGQIIICAVAGLLSLVILGGGAWMAHARAGAPIQPIDPNSFRGGLTEIFGAWKRDVLHSTPTPAPVIQPAQVQPTPAQVAQVQQPTTSAATPTPYQPSDEDMAEWKHIPPGQEAHYAEYSARREQQATPRPTPYLMPEVVAAATPDPVAARHAAWQTLHDAYVQQVRGRIAAARSDAEKGAIKQDIERWQKMNPEPPKTAATPNAEEIPIH